LGWLLVPIAIRLVGMVVGGLAGVLLADLVGMALPDFEVPGWAHLLSALLFAGIGFWLIKKMFFLTVFVAGFISALAIKTHLDSAHGFSEGLMGGVMGDFAGTPWFTVLIGLAGGLLLALLRRYLIIVLSCLAGTDLMVQAFPQMQDYWIYMAIAGIVFQMFCCLGLLHRRRRKRVRG